MVAEISRLMRPENTCFGSGDHRVRRKRLELRRTIRDRSGRSRASAITDNDTTRVGLVGASASATVSDMSIGQPGFTSQEQDSCTPFSFEESSTSPLMEDIDKDGIDVGDISNDERNNGNDEGNNENMRNEKIDTQNEDADPHKHAFQRKPRKRTSTIWNDFEEVVDTYGSKKAKCNYCLAKFNMHSTGAATQFHRHLKRCTHVNLLVRSK
ncbi:hypothetical protein F0562_018142 [Nyssa sinensis]|uniref:BED-type domain-containing protein n=1 Tax=Nyssa sinensis TaxID=561372 RepID=A0A5J4ZCT9_9ASTE|nr:hypothetical protein F0562_018142 [Nyssa sinensis]